MMWQMTPKKVGLRRKEETREEAPLPWKDGRELTNKHFVLWLLEENLIVVSRANKFASPNLLSFFS